MNMCVQGLCAGKRTCVSDWDYLTLYAAKLVPHSSVYQYLTILRRFTSLAEVVRNISHQTLWCATQVDTLFCFDTFVNCVTTRTWTLRFKLRNEIVPTYMFYVRRVDLVYGCGTTCVTQLAGSLFSIVLIAEEQKVSILRLFR